MAVGILYEWGDKLDCHTCDETLRKERGHDTDGIIPYNIDRKRSFRCPLTHITPLSYEYIKAFSFYEKSVLPNGVGYMNESYKYGQAMMVLQNEYNRKSQEDIKKPTKGNSSGKR